MSDDAEDDARAMLRAAEMRLIAAQDMLDDWIQLFDVLREEAREKGPPTEREFNDTLRHFNKARMSLHEETKKYGRQILANEGLLPDAPLDLDAIRLEIGGKLDRLRDTL